MGNSSIIFKDENFKEEVLQADIPVVVDFWAAWCGPCRIVSPIIEELAEEFRDKVKVGKLNVDENPHIAGEYSIMSISTIMIFRDGKSIKTMIGAQSKDYFRHEINHVLEEKHG